ncbi:MAG: hypothetical protein K2J61_02085, partial [Clostridia bacterium]|nr:hypothetical protein [Clostridia bacterium]
NYNEIGEMPATIKINTAGVALDVTFDGDTVTYDGETHTIALDGTLPAWVRVTYYVGEEEFTGAVNAGTYTVTAKFTVDTTTYEQPEEMTATLTIEAAVYELTGVTFENVSFVYDGETHRIFIGGAELPEWITVSYTGNEVSEIGTHTVIAKFTHENGNYQTIADMTAQIVISKAKIALPTFKGGLNYTGVTVKPTADNFNGYDSALMTFVTDKLQSGTVVGSYKAVFALNDPENYEWATATTLKKTVFAAVVYDGETEVVLNANEAAVDWNISKAVLTATKSDGALPVFASESYIGAFADVVTLKYYKDEACTEEVAADQLAKETQYFVKAELIDTDNFELDASAAQYTVKSFTYTTPAKELTVWDKVVRFLKANWLWIAIAAAALILLILIIALAARSAKKKREREERRLAEEKAERERREEREEQRRREDREERMAARMSQQAMPQYIPQPQYMPQGTPQNGQSAPMGGGSMDGTQFALIQAELAAIKAEQSAAKELAAIRAEQSAARELAELKAQQAAKEQAERSRLEAQVANMETRMGGEQASGIVGISLDKLTELVERTVEKVLERKEKPAAAAAESNAAPVTAQVPPDAVMTTVTTTKIDTTKKSAQSEPQAAPAGRTIVRNFVAPMPVDDGRVFDVGGFYKPADPVTDMGIIEDEKKDL